MNTMANLTKMIFVSMAQRITMTSKKIQHTNESFVIISYFTLENLTYYR